ncbi:hypothetical protein [Shimia biformata]|uniref:hypothetical protein n=1 Tax=Shimia biformata TaxID=1294299 RepID=UPI001951A834|nr:hypothetical protein [Shimia biformata]
MTEDRSVVRRYALACMTGTCAIAIGFLMQSSEASQAAQAPEFPQSVAAPLQPQQVRLQVNPVIQSADGQSVTPLPYLPNEALREVDLPDQPIVLLVSRDAPVAEMPAEEATPMLSCDAQLTAEAGAAATVTLTLTAPCLTGERVTFHHEDLKFTHSVGADGSLTITVPALAENAVFIAAFPSGEGAVANAAMPSLSFYDRVVVQWQGDSGLELHALEFGADYGQDGHVWRAAPRDLTSVLGGHGGFMMTLGDPTVPEAQRAEVYTFPSGQARRSGDVSLSVEAEITADNCGKQYKARSIELLGGQAPRIREIDLAMPGCDGAGGFLVLQTLLEDLKIAQK